ncbi:MAG: MHS family MFS transporter [Bifidobacteriaceae bacterium]|jgi:MHS family metabolite:H+ symporter-like MFS transporter|nr:MHS family MFS transporter [Bifidobacteriaceae bacterium]
MSNRPPTSSQDPEYAANLRRATLASSVGSALEYYDFAIYGSASALIFDRLFFPMLPEGWGLVASLGTFGIGFIARPLGGFFFGSLGDKIGRKAILMITIALMGAASTLIGALPTGHAIGLWAPLALVVLRLAQGFGAGAEQAGSSTLMAEYSPPDRRGFFSSLPFIGIFGGTLLAAGVFALVSLAPEPILLGWLWRVPFLASVALIITAVWIRSKLAESPTFVELEQHDQVSDRPLRQLLATSMPSVLRGIGLRMAENGGSYMFQTLAIAYVAKPLVDGGPVVSKAGGMLAIALGSALGMATLPLAGWISDKVGRRLVYRVGAGAMLLWAVPAWYLLSLHTLAATCVAVTVGIGLSVCVMLGSQCAYLPELFGNQHRYIGVATTREVSAVLAGGLAPTLGAALLAAFSNSYWPIAIYTLILALITFMATFLTPETKGRDLLSPEDARFGPAAGPACGNVGVEAGRVAAARQR